MNVILVTSDFDTRLNAEQLLTQSNIGFQATSDLFDAARMLGSAPYPTLLILDLTMNTGVVLEFLRQMRERDTFNRIPVLVLTALPDPQQIKTALEYGAERYLTKMFIGKNLVAITREMLSRMPATTASTNPLGNAL